MPVEEVYSSDSAGKGESYESSDDDSGDTVEQVVGQPRKDSRGTCTLVLNSDNY